MTLPTITVEVAFTTAPDDPSPVWLDVTQWVRVRPAISITRGRADRDSEVQPAKCSLTLDNSDGRFTPGNVNSPYFPNVKKGRKIRVRATWNGVTYDRVTGYVDEWPVEWADARLNIAEAAITASSRTARLGRQLELRSIIEEEFLADTPRAYFTFGEPEGSLVAANSSSTVRQPGMTARKLGTLGGGIFFGSALGPSTDGLTAALFDRATDSDGFFFQTDLTQPILTNADTKLAFECFFSVSAIDSQQSLIQIGAAGGEHSRMYVSGSNKLTAEGFDTEGLNNYLVASINALEPQTTYHAMVTESISGGNLTATLYLNGVFQDDHVVSRSGFTDRTRLKAGHSSIGGLLDGVMAHYAVYAGSSVPSAARILAHSDAGLTGFAGESAAARFTRLAGYAGVPAAQTASTGILSTSMANQVTTGKTAVALMGEVAATEDGVLFDARDGTLTLHGRAHRYNATSALILSATVGEILSIEPRLDDQGLVNDMTASRENGVTIRVTDQASITEYGLYRDSIGLFTTSDVEVADAANWKIAVGSTPMVRVPIAEVDLSEAVSSQKTAILAREIGDRITMANLPSQAPAQSMDFFIEGSTEQLSPELYQIAFNLSTAEMFDVWQLQVAGHSELGTTTRLAY